MAALIPTCPLQDTVTVVTVAVGTPVVLVVGTAAVLGAGAAVTMKALVGTDAGIKVCATPWLSLHARAVCPGLDPRTYIVARDSPVIVARWWPQGFLNDPKTSRDRLILETQIKEYHARNGVSEGECTPPLTCVKTPRLSRACPFHCCPCAQEAPGVHAFPFLSFFMRAYACACVCVCGVCASSASGSRQAKERWWW